MIPKRRSKASWSSTAAAWAKRLAVTVKQIGPTAQPADLQVVTLFNKASGQAFTGSMVELDKRLGGTLSAVRDSGQFQANALETMLITPPPGAIVHFHGEDEQDGPMVRYTVAAAALERAAA